MSQPNQDETPLQIRCPSCSRRFKVGRDLHGRTVECGGCEHRFQIGEEVILRSKKFYPGERKSPALNRFQRVPMASGGMGDGMHYQNAPDPISFEPVTPQRVIAGIAGVSGMVLMALLMMFGASSGGILDGMVMTNRLVMAGFTAVLGVILLVYANPRGRAKAMLVGLLLGGGLISLPFFFKEGSDLPVAKGDIPVVVPPPPSEVEEVDDLTKLKDLIGTGPLEDEMERLRESGSDKKAMGVWLVGLDENNRRAVEEYFERVTGAAPESHTYPRDGGNYLLVLTEVNLLLEELAVHAAAVGQARGIYPEIETVEVLVDNGKFIEADLSKLSDKNDPAFYQLNQNELESIDPVRVTRAVQRLADAEPKVHRADITRKLVSLMGEKGVDFHGPIARALATWSEEPGVAGEAAATVILRLSEEKAVIAPELMALAVKERMEAVIPVLDALWFAAPTTWEAMYGDFGPAIEPTLIRRFPETSGPLRQSAVRLLGKVGGGESLSVLKSAEEGANAELKVLIDQASTAIRERL